jgi:hypothetical protein
MSNPSDVREIIKELAPYYRETEEARQRKEDVSHFVAQNPVDPQVEKVLTRFAQ